MTQDPSRDRPHSPGPEALWQESDCYWFYDAKTGVGGFHRIGQKPNAGTGQVTLFVFARDGQRYTLNDSYTHPRSIQSQDRWQTGYRVDGHSVEAPDDGSLRFAWDEPGCSAELVFDESFYTPRDWSRTPHPGRGLDDINADGHLECSGRLRGQVIIGDKRYNIDALAHRDRSWGFRDTSRASLHRYRMFSGTVGPALSFATFLLDFKTGHSLVSGFVCRDGVEQDVRDLRVLATFDADGLSAMGATAVLTLEDGEQLRLDCRAVQGFMTPLPESECATSDTISTLTYNGQQGFCNLELCNNPGRGSYIPEQADVTLLAVEPGLSDCVSYELP